MGIFGTVSSADWLEGDTVETARRDEVKAGNAVILSNISGDSVAEYSIRILKVYPASAAGKGRDFLIQVTDRRLLDSTGGIVQGMSGSPILQNGKLVGAVTHVMVDDPTTGYGIWIGGWEGEYMYLFTADGWEGELNSDCAEGELEWVPRERVPELPVWAGDRIFLRLLAEDAPPFLLTLEYAGGDLIRAELNGTKLTASSQ